MPRWVAWLPACVKPLALHHGCDQSRQRSVPGDRANGNLGLPGQACEFGRSGWPVEAGCGLGDVHEGVRCFVDRRLGLVSHQVARDSAAPARRAGAVVTLGDVRAVAHGIEPRSYVEHRLAEALTTSSTR